MMKPIRAVALDAVGVLISPAAPIGETYYRFARRFGSKLEPQAIGSRFRAAFAKQEAIDAAAEWRVHEERERQRWQAIVRETLDDCSDVDGCLAELWSHFAKPDAWSVSSDLARLVDELQQRRISVVVASNFDSRLHAVLKEHPIRAKLAGVIVSSEVGWRKPSAAFFEATAKALGAAGEEVLFVGDDQRNDYEGAIGAGMQAVLFGEHASLPSVSSGGELLERIDALRGGK